ncbi:potassium voltage-gated channel unc-103-like isoform X1 [Clytia hemisphaerica]|uniref:Cyclic nucleotide-binding domain-containing protein n=1 Tax=Clytia hemisphaerica TaxID=252671 RepID=A0A7M5WZQ3_9CNID
MKLKKKLKEKPGSVLLVKVEFCDDATEQKTTAMQGGFPSQPAIRSNNREPLSSKVKKCQCDMDWFFKWYNKQKFLINHEGRFKVMWDWLVLLLVIFTAIQVPFYATFTRTAPVIFDIGDGGHSEAIVILTTMVDLIFIVDIFLNFRTTYVRSSSELKEQDSKKIAKHYLKTWFLIDLLAAIPFDLMVHDHENNSNSNASTVIGLLKSARLLRLFRVARKLDRYSEHGYAVLFLLMCFFMLISHWLACVWNFIATHEEHIDDSWVRRLNDDIYPPLKEQIKCCCNRIAQNVLMNKSLINTTISNFTNIAGTVKQLPPIQLGVGERYIASLYFIVSSLTGVGFGNIAATTVYEQTFSVILMMLGTLLYACIFGNMVAIVQRSYSRQTLYHNNMTSMREFLHFYKIPHDLQNNINNYTRREWLLSPALEAKTMLSNFPECLQADLTYELYQHVFFKNSAFREATLSCMRALSMKMHTMTLQANLCILRRGDEIDKLYIIEKGEIEVQIKNPETGDSQHGNKIKLGKDKTFGYDVKMMPRKPKSNSNVRTTILSEIHYIDKNDLLEIFDTYPKFAENFRHHYSHGFDLNDVEEEGYFTTPVRKQKVHSNLLARQAAPIINRIHRFSKRRKSHTFNGEIAKVRSENCLLDPRYSLKTTFSEPEENLTMSNDELSSSRKPKTSIGQFKKRALQQTMSDTSSVASNSSTIHLRPLTPHVTPRRKLTAPATSPFLSPTKLDIETRLDNLENKVEDVNKKNEQKLNQILRLLTELTYDTRQKSPTISSNQSEESLNHKNVKEDETLNHFLDTYTTSSAEHHKDNNINFTMNVVDCGDDLVDCNETTPWLQESQG